MKLLAGILLFLPWISAFAEPVFHFATAVEGKVLLAREDEFTRRLSPFDLKARMGVASTPDARAFLEFVANSAIDWPQEEQDQLRKSWEQVLPKLAALAVPLPDKISVIRTNGSEEPGAAYTRGKSIIFHPGSVQAGREVEGLLAHEIFHVVSRNHPALRDRLYAIIGFDPCGEVAFPESLQPRKMTNPDAPVNQHSIALEIDGEAHRAIPILMARGDYDPNQNRGFMSYLTLQFLVIEQKDARWIAAKKTAGAPYMASPVRVKNYHQQIGANTGYIIHPEEILAENFRLLVTGKKDLPNPEIVEKMRAILAQGATLAPRD